MVLVETELVRTVVGEDGEVDDKFLTVIGEPEVTFRLAGIDLYPHRRVAVEPRRDLWEFCDEQRSFRKRIHGGLFIVAACRHPGSPPLVLKAFFLSTISRICTVS